MPRWRKAVAALLWVFVLFTVGYAVGKEVGVRQALRRLPASPPAASGTATSVDAPRAPERRLVATYFHSTKRCKTCNTIESYAKEALDQLFGSRVAAGQIVWQTANMDDVWNSDRVRHYGLVRSSLVFSDERDGEEADYAVLNRTWDLTGDREAFFAYVESEAEMVFDAWDDDEAEGGG